MRANKEKPRRGHAGALGITSADNGRDLTPSRRRTLDPSPHQPKTFVADLAALPAALERLVKEPRWVVWRWEFKKNKKGELKWTKEPYQSRAPSRFARTNDPKTWGAYEQAVAAVAQGKADGIGYNLLGGDIKAVDLDHCRDPKTKVNAEWAQRLVDREPEAYAEVTVSGTGLRIIGLGKVTKKEGRTFDEGDESIELYWGGTGRYITISGLALDGRGDGPLPNIDQLLADLEREYDEKQKTVKSSPRKLNGSKDRKELSGNSLTLLTLPDKGAGKRHGGYDSRNALLAGFIRPLLLSKHPDEDIVDYCLDEKFKGNAIYEHCEENGGEKYVHRQIARVQKLVKKSAQTKSSTILRASEIEIVPKEWFWEGHLLRGALEMLTGLPGLGKSQLQIHLVACATARLPWPDGAPAIEPVNVIMVTAEDALAQEVVPRLVAANADLKRVFILQYIKTDEKNGRQFLLNEDLEQLEMEMEKIGDVGLITLDPITAYMGGKMDSHKATEVRSQLGPLKDFAERNNIAISAITHPPKNSGQKSLDHFIGSQAFVAAARIGHACYEEMEPEEDSDDEESGGRRGKMVPTGRIYFTNPKNNAAKKMPTLAYRIEQISISPNGKSGTIGIPHVVWDKGSVNITADQAAAIAGGSNKEDRRMGNQIEVQRFLRHILNDGPVAVEQIQKEASEKGFTRNQLRTAKERLKIEAAKSSLGGGWVWILKF